MSVRLSDFRYKEVINVGTGQRLGYIEDVEFDQAGGKIISFIVPGPSKLFGVIGREDDYVLPWESVTRIGSDIVLVETSGELPRTKPVKKPL